MSSNDVDPPEKEKEILKNHKSDGLIAFIKQKVFRKREPIISKPKNIQVVNHVVVDVNSPTGLSGIPKEWETVLMASNITKEEVVQNGSAVAAILRFHFNGIDNSFNMIPQVFTDSLQCQGVTLQEKNPSEVYIGQNQRLGEGGYSSVYKGTHIVTGKPVAIKVCSEENFKYIKHEIQLQSQSHHTCIVSLDEVYRWNGFIYMIMEYMDRGSLAELVSPKYPIPEQYIAYICRCLLVALDALHSNNRIHRDIKSDNILLDSQGHVKLADFGFATFLLKRDDQRKSVVGTPFWMAPELIQGNGYGIEVDVWSLGITALEMADGLPPYYGEAPLKALLKIHSGPAPSLKDSSRWSNKFKSFLAMCLEKEPTNRATVKELLMHPFMQEAATPESFASFVNSALARRKHEDA